jgi:hypothetical protein
VISVVLVGLVGLVAANVPEEEKESVKVLMKEDKEDSVPVAVLGVAMRSDDGGL